MCLRLTKQNKDPKVAEKPIECYKLVLKASNGLITPFMHNEIYLGEIIKAYPRVPMVKKRECASEHSRYKFFVCDGVIHTFKTIEEAKKVARIAYFQNFVIVKCTIPTGSLYFEGVFDDTGIQCYASTSVRYWKKIVYQK